MIQNVSKMKNFKEENYVTMVNKDKLRKKREETRKEILQKLKTCDRFGVVRPFGFGKTYLILDLCNKLKGKKLVLEPNLEIIKNISKNLPLNSEAITYHTLLRKKFNPKEILNYDYVFLDEMHRTLANKWGKVLRDILKDFKGKVIGFTATPKRGDGRNPIDEIFNGEQISELSLIDAIIEEMIPNPTYVTGIYELKDKILNNSRLRVQLKNYDLKNSLNEMFNKYLNLNDTLKIMAFSYTINDIKQTENYINEWFKRPVNHYYYHSCQHEEQNEIELQKFKNATSGINVIHSVNQLNEGFHFDKLDALIFLRKTNSDVVYLQQLGRGLSENLNNIVVFDLMNNFMRNTNGYYKLVKDYSKEHNIDIDNVKTINDEPLKIYCEQQDLIYLLKEESYKYKPVEITEEQEKFIRENYPQKGIKELSNILQIPIGALNCFLRRKNIYVKKLYPLTEEQQKYILDNYKKMGVSEIARNINKGQTSIINFLYKNNLEHKKTTRREPCTEEEINFILKNNKILSRREICKRINRCNDTVIKILRQYNVYENPLVYKFSKQQEEIIRKNHKTKTCSAIGKLIGTNDGVVERYLKVNNLERFYAPRKKRGENKK